MSPPQIKKSRQVHGLAKQKSDGTQRIRNCHVLAVRLLSEKTSRRSLSISRWVGALSGLLFGYGPD